jgi:hypothetical protein
MPPKAWQDQELQGQVHQDLELGQTVANLDQVVRDQVAQVAHVQDLDLQNPESVAVVHREVSRDVLLLAEEAAVLAAVQRELSVKVAQEVNLRPESQSAPREKNSNKEVFQVLVEQLFQEEMAQQ